MFSFILEIFLETLDEEMVVDGSREFAKEISFTLLTTDIGFSGRRMHTFAFNIATGGSDGRSGMYDQVSSGVCNVNGGLNGEVE